jgi:hypothetical protein
LDNAIMLLRIKALKNGTFKQVFQPIGLTFGDQGRMAVPRP